MSYNIDQNTNELVIDGWEKGISPSPYQGIANIRNLNTSYYPGVAYVNYRRQQCSTPSGNETITQDSFNGGTSATGTGNDAALQVNLVAYYKFDQSSGDATDATGNGFTLTNNNTTPYSSALINNGADFGTANTNKSFSTTSNLGIANTAISISVWVKLRTEITSGIYYFAQENDNGTQTAMAIYYDYNGGSRQIVFQHAKPGVGSTQIASPLTMGTSSWYHFVLSSDGTTGTGYVNNSSIGTFATNGNGNTGTSVGFFVGSRLNVDSYASCYIDELGVWSRGITGAEVTKLYGSGAGNQYPFSITNPTNITYSHTCTSSANRLLIIATQVYSSDTITSVTYNSVAATLLGSVQGKDNTQVIALYGLLNPSVGANTVSVTRTTSNASINTMGACSVSYYDVKQSGLPDAFITNTGTTNVTTTFTTVADKSYVIAYTASAATVSVSTNSTSIGVPTRSDSTSFLLSRYSSNPATPPGSVSMTNLTSSTGSTIGQIMVSFAPFAFSMTNPVQKASSPLGLNYILDDSGSVWKQSAVNSTTFNRISDGTGRQYHGAGGLAYWNNYLVVLGSGAIEFCGDGTGDAGIISTNWNKKVIQSTVTVTSQLLPFGTNFTNKILAAATSGTLTANWSGVTGAYTVQFNNVGQDIRTATFTNGSATVTWAGGLTGDTPTPAQINMYQMVATNGTFVGYTSFTVSTPVTFSSTVSLPTGLTANTTYYLLATVDLTGGTIIQFSATLGGSFIALTDAGSGVITMSILSPNVPPLVNTTITGFTWGNLGLGSSTMTLSSPWLNASGIYNVVDTLGNNFPAFFSNNSTNVSLTWPSTVQPTGTYQVQILNTATTNYRTWVSKVDGNLYFANGRWLGRIQSSANFNVTLNPGIPVSYTVNYAATGVLQPQDSIVDMTDLRGQMIILGNYDIYPWDYLSVQPSSSSPVGEQGVKIFNLLNNVYILAGTKGNIYISNGATAQLFYKIPDFIAGVIDPIWSFGDIMAHRSRLFFQAIAKTASGTNILAGIFSMIASPAMVGELASGLVMENQNSYGLTPTAGALSNGILIDNQQWSSGQNSYYSAWSNGATTGGVDYNDTSLWQNYEPMIETDIIPIGTILDKASLGQCHFKLDRPMTTGDSIRLSWRPSLSDSYTVIGTTTTNQLSEYFPSNIMQSQWAQFKVEFKCASSGSSRIPLREIRIQTK